MGLWYLHAPAPTVCGSFMTFTDLAPILTKVGLPLVVIVSIAYVLLVPERAEKVAGWIWAFIARIFKKADKTAVALRVQGEINTARAVLLKNAPEDLIEGKLKIRWNDAETAHAAVRDGDVVVFMRPAKHQEENVANALMTYLPKALIPRARRYVDRDTMRAVDLTVAKGVLGVTENAPGVLDSFFEKHLEPACADEEMRTRVLQMDEIDLHGWLARVLLPEFRLLGDQLYPGEPTNPCFSDAAAFADWLHKLAAREPGDESLPLAYRGRFLRVGVVLVANRYKLAERGIEPYRKQAKRLIYSGDYEAVYLMGRDDNIPAVLEIARRLEGDGRVVEGYSHVFRLRSDFKKRKLWREKAVIACLRTRLRAGGSDVPDEDLADVELEVFDPAGDIRASRSSSAGSRVS